MTPLEALWDAFEEAKSAWTGCHWETEFGSRRLNLCGLRSRQAAIAAKATRGEESTCWNEACQWLQVVEHDAARAAELADMAIRALGRHQFALAERHFGEAVALEQKYRGGVAYGRLQRASEQWFPPRPACS